MDEHAWLREAVALARGALEDDDGGPFGAVVVRDGRIVGRGRNRVLARQDPSAHAEVEAIRDACRSLGTHDLGGATLYASCEPCPMCLGVAFWSRVDRVVFATDRAAAGAAGFADVDLHAALAWSGRAARPRLEHRPLGEAREVMEAWSRRPDRRLY